MTEEETPDVPSMIDEIEHGSGDYTDEELLEQSAFNAQALFLGTVQTLRELDGDLERWRAAMADIFARGWDLGRPWRAPEILDALLTNYRSFGADIVQVELAASPPMAVVAELPDLELADSLDLDPIHIGELFEIGALIVRRLGGSLSWVIDGETGDIHLSVSVSP